ncbi:hypothetical protein NGRRMQZB_64 [Escherichia phage Dru_SM1]|nr:MAG TPA: hypothetical protein [Bacteriophage sp.]
MFNATAPDVPNRHQPLARLYNLPEIREAE